MEAELRDFEVGSQNRSQNSFGDVEQQLYDSPRYEDMPIVNLELNDDQIEYDNVQD